MAKSKKIIDQYSQCTYVDMDMSAANTISFQKINFAVGIFQGVALMLHRIEYHPDQPSVIELVANTDILHMAITTRNTLSTLEPADLSLINRVSLYGMGAAVEPVQVPIIQDFTGLPGGGRLCMANPLYFAMFSAGFAAAASARLVMHYTFMDLDDAQARELLQTLIPGNV